MSYKKYRNKPTRGFGKRKHILFASLQEAIRCQELDLMVSAGIITSLELQHEITIFDSFIGPDGKNVRGIKYKADFSYWDRHTGYWTMEDVKGWDEKTRKYRTTPVFELKKKLILKWMMKQREAWEFRIV